MDREAREDSFLKVINDAYDRRRNGPICGRCVHSTFQPSEIPEIVVPTGSITDVANMSIRVDTCRNMVYRSGRPLRIQPDGGNNCEGFELDPEKSAAN